VSRRSDDLAVLRPVEKVAERRFRAAAAPDQLGALEHFTAPEEMTWRMLVCATCSHLERDHAWRRALFVRPSIVGRLGHPATPASPPPRDHLSRVLKSITARWSRLKSSQVLCNTTSRRVGRRLG